MNRTTQEMELDCLDQLEATPAILRGLMCDLSVEDTEWKPAPDRFSIAEVLAHLFAGHYFIGIVLLEGQWISALGAFVLDFCDIRKCGCHSCSVQSPLHRARSRVRLP